MTWQKTKSTSRLTQQTVKGAFWSYLSFLGGKGLGFPSAIIMDETVVTDDSLIDLTRQIVPEFVDQGYQTGHRAIRLRVPTRGPR